jgi:hypothetical protein
MAQSPWAPLPEALQRYPWQQVPWTPKPLREQVDPKAAHRGLEGTDRRRTLPPPEAVGPAEVVVDVLEVVDLLVVVAALVVEALLLVLL